MHKFFDSIRCWTLQESVCPQKALKEKEEHIEQLLRERDLERSEVARAAAQVDEVSQYTGWPVHETCLCVHMSHVTGTTMICTLCVSVKFFFQHIVNSKLGEGR